MFPLRTLDYPNPAPGCFHSTSESYSLIVKTFPLNSLSKWLATRSLGTVLHIADPIGKFCPVEYKEIEDMYFVCTGSSFKEILGMILWTLQTSRLSINKVLYFIITHLINTLLLLKYNSGIRYNYNRISALHCPYN